MAKRAVTRKDVAAHANVSVAVVSYVLNNRNNIREETRQRVLSAIQELDYQPNLAARSLKTKKSQQFAVLVNSIADPFEAGILTRVETAAKQAGYFVSFQTYQPEYENELKLQFMGRTDGLILIGQSISQDILEHFLKHSIPLVSVNQPFQSSVSFVDINWTQAMQQLVGHLIERGHSRIGFMNHGRANHHYDQRYSAFQETMKCHGLVFEPTWLSSGEGRFEQAFDAMTHAIQTGLPFSAVVCANDLMAIGVIAACRHAGLSVPDHVAVTGCEDILLSAETSPPLTTIHYPREQVGDWAVSALLRQMEGGAVSNHLLDSQLLIRGTT